MPGPPPQPLPQSARQSFPSPQGEARAHGKGLPLGREQRAAVRLRPPSLNHP